jgi:hypothetical protein
MPAAATATKPVSRSVAAPRRKPRPAPRRTSPRTARSTRPAPAARAQRSRRRTAPTGGFRLVPVAVGRIPLAVGGVADSGVVLGLTRGRVWIGLLGALLVGIVAVNVMTLSLNATSSKTAAVADQLERENSALQSQIAEGLSNDRLQIAAERLGLAYPDPLAVRYLTPHEGDAAAAAERIAAGEITIGEEYVPPPPVEPVVPVTTTPTDTAVTDPTAVTTDPAVVTTDPAVTATPVAPTTTVATTDPAATAAGGVPVP